MTLGQAKAMAMKLMDEYMVDTPPTDDEETLAKLNSMFQAAQIFVCTIKPLEKYFIKAILSSMNMICQKTFTKHSL